MSEYAIYSNADEETYPDEYVTGIMNIRDFITTHIGDNYDDEYFKDQPKDEILYDYSIYNFVIKPCIITKPINKPDYDPLEIITEHIDFNNTEDFDGLIGYIGAFKVYVEDLDIHHRNTRKLCDNINKNKSLLDTFYYDYEHYTKCIIKFLFKKTFGM